MNLLDLICKYAADRKLSDSFIVGGSVRDMLLGRKIKDVDIAVKENPADVGKSFAESVGGSFVVLDKDFGIMRVAKDNEYIDMCRMRGSSIADDLADRDLTINAMAIPLLQFAGVKPESGTARLDNLIIDPFNGRNDLKYGIIRMVSEENLVNDPLRLLRVYRFSATLNFQIEVQTASSVRSNATLISNAAVERISEELRQILTADDSYSAIKLMEKDGFILHLFPELRGFSIEMWNHCRQSFGYAEHILRNLPLYFLDGSTLMWDYFSEGYRSACLKLSVLLNDAETAEKVCSRLRLSKKEAGFIMTMLSRSEAINALSIDNTQPTIGLMRDSGDDIYALAIRALATSRVCQLSGNPLLSVARWAVSLYQDEFLPRKGKLPLITGDDLVGQFGLSPSPIFREILSGVEQKVLEGTVSSREEALRAAGEIVREKGIQSE